MVASGSTLKLLWSRAWLSVKIFPGQRDWAVSVATGIGNAMY